jgi:hypothetical protein
MSYYLLDSKTHKLIIKQLDELSQKIKKSDERPGVNEASRNLLIMINESLTSLNEIKPFGQLNVNGEGDANLLQNARVLAGEYSLIAINNNTIRRNVH